jgi:NAD(P)-dependent dehydrogenase (short-subunit alcohol dehydrogenase family)
MRLKNKTIIVTGGTSGIGAAIARAVVREGGTVLVHGINQGEGEALVKALGASAHLCIADLRQESAPQTIVKACLDHFGKIDGIVNNAAVIKNANISQLTFAEYQEIMQVNLTSSLFLFKSAFEELKKSAGSVLNIGSINAYAGESSLLAYSISKGGMQVMTRNLANANGVHGIRVNQINPGWVLTEREEKHKIAGGMEPGWPERLTRTEIPFGKMTTPEQVAEAAIYWIGDESKPFTGAVVELEQFSIIGRNPEKL